MALTDYKPGLEGVVAAQTRMSMVDGQAGVLVIGGFLLEELALNATFEETVFLLWNDRLPNAAELKDFRQQLASRRELPAIAFDVLHAAAAQKAPVMDALRMAGSTLSLKTPGESMDGLDANHRDALVAVARFPTIVAAYWRILNGQEPVAPRADLSHAANYLYMIFGEEPSPERTRGMETYLNTVIDHGLNASTFTARVIVATQSDIISSVVGAVGALKGPLHGGAPGPALDMVFEVGTEENAEPVLRKIIERGDRLMGFGHRVYKVRDPRADVLSTAAIRLFENDGDLKLYNLAKHVEQVALVLLEEYKPGRHLQTNVEFFTALILHGLGLETDLFAPTFAVSRVGGWTAHCFEQIAEGRLIRPQSVFTGPQDRKWTPVESR